MKNEIGYFYHLYPEKLVKKGKKYCFQYQNKNYMLYQYTRALEELEALVLLNQALVNQNVFFPKIVKNVMQQALTFINGKYYLLKEEVLPLQKITWKEVIYQAPYLIPVSHLKRINRTNWTTLWEKKIDYFEYQREHIYQKFPILAENLDYFIGLAENAIAYVKEVEQNLKKSNKDLPTFSRKRIHANTTLSDFYDPLIFVVDHKARDVSEFMKSCFFEMDISFDEMESWLETIDFSTYGWGLFFGRMLFPSYFFDLYEAIVNGIEREEQIEKILQKIDRYQDALTLLQIKIQKKVRMPSVGWLNIKKEVL